MNFLSVAPVPRFAIPSLRRLAPAAFIFLVAGCGDDPAGPRLAGRFVLTMHGDASLPVVVGTSTRPSGTGGPPVQCDVELRGMSLELIGTAVTRYETSIERCENGLQIPRNSVETGGRQERTAQGAVITFRGSISATYEERMFVRETADGFVVERREFEPEAGASWVDATVLTFERVP